MLYEPFAPEPQAGFLASSCRRSSSARSKEVGTFDQEAPCGLSVSCLSRADDLAIPLALRPFSFTVMILECLTLKTSQNPYCNVITKLSRM